MYITAFTNLRGFDIVAFVAMLGIYYSYYKKLMWKANVGCFV